MTTPPVLSVSQVEKFDHEQPGGCQLRWWFEDVRGLRPESTAAHEDGHQGHRLLAHYLTTGERPGRVRLGKAINAVIDSGVLPAPRLDLHVEERFSLQEHRDAAGAWVPLDLTRTLWHAGHPWEGFVDLRFRHRDGAVTVWDHKFSSDIRARALPAEKLVRTVQMPVYALDTLRRWPDATAVNLVHLYVSRRGVESFIRHQRVSVEQVQERAVEIAGLVQQMDVVRGVTAQDDVPFNRAACHARTGCPHQFRCNVFKRRGTVMDLTDEEKAMFGVLSDEPAKPPASAEEREMVAAFDEYVRGEDPAISKALAKAPREEKPTPARDVLTAAQSSGSVLDLDDIFEPPVASTPKPQPAPTCAACGEVLTPENSSRLKTGDVKHIGCAKDARTPEPIQAPRKFAAPDGSSVDARCPDCPHPAHEGKPCEGKRGRGKCQCGVAVEQTKPQRPPPPAVPTFTAEAESEDVGGWSEAGEPAPEELSPRAHEAAEESKREEQAEAADRAAVAAFAEADVGLDADRLRIAELEEQPRTAREIIDAPDLAPRGTWSGTLAVNVTVELGPSTLAFLAGLVKR